MSDATKPPGELSVELVTDDRGLEACLSVRTAVFVEEQGVPAAREIDGRDEEASHLLAVADGPVGTLRIRDVDSESGGGGTAKIERVAVLEAHRGLGIGRRLMTTAEEHIAEQPYGRIYLEAQVEVLAFYRGLGYEVRSEPFDDVGIPHRAMDKQL
jgi:predicted GNAT family N-acyltransferase